jgi:hypothetical protein
VRITIAVLPMFLLAGCTLRGADHEPEGVAHSAVMPDPLRAGSADSTPTYLQSNFGVQGNFELAVPSTTNGLLYYWRDNDHGLFWNGPDAVFTDAGHFDALAMIQSNYGGGNMELVVRRQNRLTFLFRDLSDPVTPWHGPWDIATGVSGSPGFIQSHFGQQGNFEVVIPSATGGLLHYWRDNDNGMVWRGPVAFFQNWGQFDAVTLIESSYGNLEGLARRGSELYFFFHDTDWRGPWRIGTNVAGNPVLFQGRYGSVGNFEVAVPSASGGVDYYWRDNDHGMVWNGPFRLFPSFGQVDAIGMFESNYGTPGNIEMLLRQGQSLFFAFRPNLDPWQGPFAITAPTDPSYAVEGTPLLRRAYTQYLGTFSHNPASDEELSGIVGTDLGVSFEAAAGQLAFLFGDSWTPGHVNDNWDSIAFTNFSTVDRTAPPTMRWVINPTSGVFDFMDLPNLDGGGMNVPLDGVAINGQNYIFQNSGWHAFCGDPGCPGAHGTLALGVMNGLSPSGITTLFVTGSQRFTNLSAVPIGGYVYLFGAAEPYRYGAVYLARAPLAGIGDLSQWQYYRGVRQGIPVFGPGEGTAVPLFAAGFNWTNQNLPLNQRPSNGVGELSVRMHEGNKLLMTYNASDTAPQGRGIYMRTAQAPWGPWSAPELLLTAGDAYGRWQHRAPLVVGADDGLGEYARQDEWGGEYGPYLVPRWFTDNGRGEYGIVYTLSSWNPYQDHLIRTVMTGDGHAVPPPANGVGWPKAALTNGDFATYDTRGWTQIGGPFGIYQSQDGTPRLTTYGASGDATVGQLYQDVSIDSTTTKLNFTIHGGGAEVKLIWNRNGETVRAVHARNDNTTNLQVSWDLRDYQGESVRVFIDDHLTAPWGFIDVGGFQFQ